MINSKPVSKDWHAKCMSSCPFHRLRLRFKHLHQRPGLAAVYGTLRAGGINDIHQLRPGIACAGTTELIGSLHDLGWYPGLRQQGTQPVLAEVYPLDDELEQRRDGIEGLWPRNLGEYAKRLLTIALRAQPGALELHNVQILVYEALPQALQHTVQIARKSITRTGIFSCAPVMKLPEFSAKSRKFLCFFCV